MCVSLMQECPGAKTKAWSMWKETEARAMKNCSHTNQILELKTQCLLSDALVFRTIAWFELTETMIVDPQQSKTATGPVKYADEMWDCCTLKDFQRETRSSLFPLASVYPFNLPSSLPHTHSRLHYYGNVTFLFIIRLGLFSPFTLQNFLVLNSIFALYQFNPPRHLHFILHGATITLQ